MINLPLPVRLLLVGFPGAGKTGSLAPLITAGYKLRIIDFDGNYEPLLQYADQDKFAANVDLVHLEDTMKLGGIRGVGGPLETDGIPTAFANAFHLMDSWEYVNGKNGMYNPFQPLDAVVNLGRSRDWGLDTIVVLDGLTGLNDALMNRARKMQNKTLLDTADRTYNLAMAEEVGFVKKFTSIRNRFHTITISHLKMIGPKDTRKGDSDIAKDIKEQINALIETKYFPNVLGWLLPQEIGREWPTILKAEKETKGGVTRRYLKDVSGPELDLKFPAMVALPAKLEITNGMLTVFKALSPASVEALTQKE